MENAVHVHAGTCWDDAEPDEFWHRDCWESDAGLLRQL
jgi:hypothetical protein